MPIALSLSNGNKCLENYFAGAALLPDLIKTNIAAHLGELARLAGEIAVAEEAVLNAARNALDHPSSAVLIEIHCRGSSNTQRVLSLLSEPGYSTYIFAIRMLKALCVATPVSVTAMVSQRTVKP